MVVKDYVAHPFLQAEALPEIDCVLCVSPGHALSTGRSVSLADLHQHVELSVQDSSDQGDDRHMFGGERVYYLSGFPTKKQALLAGLGFGWMPMHLVKAELASGALREVRYVGGSRYRFTPQLVHRMSRPLGRAGSRLALLMRQSLPGARSRRRAASARRPRQAS